MGHVARYALGLVVGLGMAIGCSGEATAPPPPPAPAPTEPVPTEPTPAQAPRISVRNVVFARALDDNWQPVGGPVAGFHADDHTVWARVTIAGRPTQGTITTKWMWRDLEVASADIDLADLNGGVLFSFGQDTFLRAYMTTRQLYVGNGHRLDLHMGDELLGSYPIPVVPPPDARPSSFTSAELYDGDPSASGGAAPSRAFRPEQPVFVGGRVALGKGSWFDAVFTVNGQPAPQLTQEAIGPEDGGDTRGFVFRAHPEDGWPPGTHHVALVLDDREVAAFDFTVAAE